MALNFARLAAELNFQVAPRHFIWKASPPRTGRPTVAGPIAVSVVAGEAWSAEIAAKALMVRGRTADDVLDGAAAVLFGPDGSVSVSRALQASWAPAVAAAVAERVSREAGA